ncbi:TPA: hypothetical protein ACH3X2_009207 [Trebouxia sp. C0005]
MFLVNTVNKVGAGTWGCDRALGQGYARANGAGGPLSSFKDAGGSSASPPPPPPPPPPPSHKNATLRPVAKGAKTVYAVKATCTLLDVLPSDFQ